MATFGNTTATDNNWTGKGTEMKVGGKYTLSEAGSVSSISVRLTNTNTGHAACYAKALIYSNSSNNPNSLLGTSQETSIADNAAWAWKTFTFSTPVALSTGTYWLAYFGDSTADGVDLSYGVAAGDSQYDSDTYSDGPEATWTVDQVRTYLLEIYATYTATPSGFTGLTVTRLLQG